MVAEVSTTATKVIFVQNVMKWSRCNSQCAEIDLIDEIYLM